jgi:hypothetical protein
VLATIRNDGSPFQRPEGILTEKFLPTNLPTANAVTAEVASSSLVVPAIPNQALTPVEEFSRGHKKVQIPRTARL